MLEFEKTYDTIRVYFNSRAAYPYIFSVDDGDQNNELITPSVVGQGIHSYEYNGQVPNPLHPVAWAEYKNARVHRVNEGEDLFVENSE